MERVKTKQPDQKRLFALMLFMCICAFVLFAPLAAHSQYALDPVDLRHHIRILMSHELYQDSETFVDSLLATPDQAHWGLLYLATLRLTQQVDFGDTLYSGQLLESIAHSERIFTSKLEGLDSTSDPILADRYFGLATLSSLRAQYANEIEGKPLRAYPYMKDARKYFNLALDVNPEHRDAKIALVVFDFWQSHVLRFINWLPLLGDDRQESLETLIQYIDTTPRPDVSTAVSLMWILIEAGNPEKTLKIAEKYFRIYGPLRSILEPAGKAAFILEDYEKSTEYYQQLISSLERQDRLNKTRIIGACNRLAIMSNLQKDYSSVVFYADKALSFNLNKEESKRKTKDLNRLVSLRNTALDAMEK